MRGKLKSLGHGKLSGIVIAVNGVVRASGGLRTDGDDQSFSVLIPEDSLRAGRNDVRVLGVRGAGSSQALVGLGD